ncbi:hypothetical protein VNO77_32272 [Canavalia gladiata]|uniref:C2H2-type domain-containing protein n=1 Tax=Canavalia gladiata TaxID=3824 RepID=A0AAN9Q448_CANGL
MERSQYWMYMKREQIHKSHIEAKVGDDNNNYSWEERAFAEDAARILGGSIWPPRSYSCTFCKREFRSAQALGGHMNIHRRDRARLKQNLSLHNYEPFDDDDHHHHKNDFKSLLGNHHFSAADEISTQIDCCLSAYSCPATTITTTRFSPSRFSTTTSTRENCGVQHNISPCFSSSSFPIILGQNMGSPNSEPDQGVVNAKEYNFNGLDCNDYVETSLSVGQKSSPSGDRASISCKRLKTSISSPPVFLKPCSNAKSLAFQPAEIFHGHNHGIEDLDLELRLGKQQKVNKLQVRTGIRDEENLTIKGIAVYEGNSATLFPLWTTLILVHLLLLGFTW